MMSALVLENVSVALSGRDVVRDASLELHGGEISAIVGPNGAGKSTLLKAIAGVLPHCGKITIDTSDVRLLTKMIRAKTISYLAQNDTVAWAMAVESIVALGRLPHMTSRLVARPEDRTAVQHALERTELVNFAKRSVDRLSQGERARVLLARALCTEAPVLIADEPIAAQDPRHQLQTLDILAEEAKRGVAVVVVMHDLALASAYASRIILMHEGRVLREGPPADVLTGEALLRVYGVKPASGSSWLTPHFHLAD